MTHHITDEQIQTALGFPTHHNAFGRWPDLWTFGQIKAALLALAAPQVEPVAWLHWLHGPVRLFMNKDEAEMELDRLNRVYPVNVGDRCIKPLYTAPAPAVSMSEIDLQDDDALRFAQRVLESSDAPESDRKAARDTLVAIRTRVRKARAALTPSQEAGVPSNRWLTAAVDAAMVEMKNISPPMRRSECERLIRAALTAAPNPPARPAVPEDVARLDALGTPGWELSMNDAPECGPDELWQVHRVSGGRNDREWTLIGSGANPRAAIDAARAAEKGGE